MRHHVDAVGAGAGEQVVDGPAQERGGGPVRLAGVVEGDHDVVLGEAPLDERVPPTVPVRALGHAEQLEPRHDHDGSRPVRLGVALPRR